MTTDNDIEKAKFAKQLRAALHARKKWLDDARKIANRPPFDPDNKKDFVDLFNSGYRGGLPLTPRVAGHWMEGMHLPSRKYRSHLEKITGRSFYFLTHGFERGDHLQIVQIEAQQARPEYLRDSAAIRLSQQAERPCSEEKEVLNNILNGLTQLIQWRSK
jgi:hypothetical protein